jgi:hypothetical protein
MWRQRLADQAASAMTIAAWCRRSGYSDSLFHYWKSAIAKRDGRRVKQPPRKAGAIGGTPPEQACFAQLEFAPRLHVPTAPTVCAAGDAIEIVLPGSRMIRVGVGFDASTLCRVLAALEGR